MKVILIFEDVMHEKFRDFGFFDSMMYEAPDKANLGQY